jgi:hypothetical protein
VLKSLVLRNVACPIVIPSAAFPIADFAEKLDLGSIEQQIQVPEFAIWEYADLRLQVLPDRLQLGFRQQASGDLVRLAVEEFVRIVRTDFKVNTIGFNANLGLELEDGEPEPTAHILNAEALVQRLQGSSARGGVWLVYHDNDSSRWWVELVPVPDDDRRWLFSINRRYDSFPEDEEAQAEIIDWFQNAKARLGEQCKALMEG